MAIVVTIPSTRLFAFSPSVLTITGLTAGQKIDFTFNTFTASRYADGAGAITMPLSKVLKSCWATSDVGDTESASAGSANSGTQLVKTLTLDVKSGGSHIGASPYTITAIWGALQVAEVEPTTETIYRFDTLPLTVTQNIGNKLFADATDKGNLSGKDYFVNTESVVYIKQDSTVLRTINIVDLPYCSETDIYLKWVNRFGKYRYFAFKKGASRQDTKAGDSFTKELLNLSSTTNGLYKSQNQLIDISGSPIILAGIPTATYEQQKHIQTLESSVKAWLYNTADSKWIEVTVKMNPIVIDERYQSNQAIELEVILPNLYLQSL